MNAATTYYVATTGDNANNGTSLATPWRTVTYAAKKAMAGDTVYIKAGRYTGELVVVSNTGTEGAPILFQGYQNTPGDTPDPHYTPGVALDSTVLPVLENVDEALRSAPWGTGIAMGWYINYVTIRNIGVTNFCYGVFPQRSDHVLLENLYVIKQGTEAGDGNGIWFRECTNITVRNCVATDASMGNISLGQCQNGLIENCKSYAVTYDPAGSATDYHIVIQDSQNIVVRDCLADNLHWTHTDVHTGHGIGIKDTAYADGYRRPHSINNQIVNCVTRNIGENFYVAHEVSNNSFENCRAISQWRNQNSWSYGIAVRDGAHDNTFRNCRVEGVRFGIGIHDTVEGPKNTDGSPKVQICSNNAIINSVFVDSNVAMELWNADGNLLKNCVFDSVQSVFFRFLYPRNSAGNACRNSIVTNVLGVLSSHEVGSIGGEIPFTYSDFWNNSFSKPAGIGNLALDPLFADAASRDYHLKSQRGRWNATTSAWVQDAQTSPCIDAGDPGDDCSAEPNPNGSRINMGVHGGTLEASRGTTSQLDLNDDQSVDVLDLAILASAFGTSHASADLNGSGLVDDADITLMLAGL